MLNISISDGYTHISVCHQFILCAKIPLFNDSSKLFSINNAQTVFFFIVSCYFPQINILFNRMQFASYRDTTLLM